MPRSFSIGIATAAFCVLTVAALQSQESSPHPPDYPGVRIFIPGVFVTPVPGAPFSGNVEILSKQAMPDGTTYTRRTMNYIARNSLGLIHNERRRLEPPSFRGEPPVLEWHIYNPQTRLNTFLFPETHIARQNVLLSAPSAPKNSTPDTTQAPPNTKNLRVEDLGVENFAGLPLHGTRKLRTVPAAVSGTGHDVTITDDYWYSEELKVYLVVRHNDPRTGEQYVGITEVDRKEPSPATFQIPPEYKVVDETPIARSKH